MLRSDPGARGCCIPRPLRVGRSSEVSVPGLQPEPRGGGLLLPHEHRGGDTWFRSGGGSVRAPGSGRWLRQDLGAELGCKETRPVWGLVSAWRGSLRKTLPRGWSMRLWAEVVGGWGEGVMDLFPGSERRCPQTQVPGPGRSRKVLIFPPAGCSRLRESVGVWGVVVVWGNGPGDPGSWGAVLGTQIQKL
jgi:hypothetical protein